MTTSLFLAIACFSFPQSPSNLEQPEPTRNYLQRTDQSLYYFDSIGRISLQERVWYELSVSPLLSLLRDKDYSKRLELDEESIDWLIESIDELRKTGKEIDYSEFQQSVEKIEKEIKKILTQDQVRECEDTLKLSEFYRLGPVEYSKKVLLPHELQKQIRTKSNLLATELEEAMRVIEKDFLVECFSKINKSDWIRMIIRDRSPKRIPVLSTTWLAFKNELFSLATICYQEHERSR